MSEYKGYRKSNKKATMKYISDKQKQVVIRWKKEDYESHIEPAINMSGLATSTFIKEAVNEKIERMLQDN